MHPDVRRPGFVVTVMAGLLLTLAVTVDRAAAAEVFTPKHVAKVRMVTSAVISPDGQSVAYTLAVPREPGTDDDGSAWVELHVVRPDGSSRPYVAGEVNIGNVQWTPDGSGISFLAKRGDDEHKSLYVIPIDGGEARKVLEHKTDISGYDWSPDGQRVAFLSKEKEPEEKKKLADKGFKADIYEEELRYTQVWIGRVDDDEAEPRLIELPGSASELHWSPAGDRLALALAPTPLIDDYYMYRRIRIVDVESGDIVTKIENPGKLGDIRWSPDGTHLAVIAGKTIHDPAEGRLMVASASDGTLVKILPDYMGHVSSIAWQDNDTIMFLGQEGVWTTFKEIERDGSNLNVIVPGGKVVLSGLSLSRDGQRAAMRGESPKHPYEVFTMKHGDSLPRQVTDSNPWFADMRFAKQDVIRYEARDGAAIEALLIWPLDAEAGTRYPLIVTVHGGPESHYRNGFLTRYASPGQVAAAQGYAVVYPNYRGSTGRGVAFTMAHQADYGGKEFDDVVDGVDYLIEKGLVDRDRVGVTGGSYGGFATAWCSTYHTKRFAAGVMFVGISDHISKAGTTDIPDEMTLVHARKRVWEDWDFFLERSPIKYVEQARTPLLILHGKDDTRVHPSQSMELFRHLKTLGRTPVRLVWYPGEGHGNRKAGARYDYNLRMMRWFNHYLKGPGGDPPDPQLDYGIELEDEEDASEEGE